MQPPEKEPWRLIRAAVDGYASYLVPLIGQSYGQDCMQRAWREFTLGSDTTFGVDDPHAELFFSWLFHSWVPQRKKGDRLIDEHLYGVCPTRAYLAAKAADLDPLLRRYLEACLAARFGFYQVLECRPGAGFSARELVTDRELEINEALASVSLTSLDIVFARLPSVDGVVLVDAIAPFSFPQTFAPRVRRQRRGRQARKLTDLASRRLYFELLGTHLRSTDTGEWDH